MKKILILLFAGLAFTRAGSQNSGRITGSITDQAGRQVEHAQVFLSGTSHLAYTDEQGRFTFGRLQADTYSIVAVYAGFAPLHREVSVTERQTAVITFSLPGKVHVLKEVSITSTGIKGEIKDIPGTVSVIDAVAIRESGAQSIGQIITRVPGTNYLDEDGRGLKPNIGLRGLDPLRNRNLLVLMDGKFPVGMTYYGDPAAYYMTPVQSIERVEVIKGASPVLYGGYSVGGVVNMITKKAKQRPETSADISYGSYNSLNAQVAHSGNSGSMSYLASALHRQGDSYRDRGRFDINDFTVQLSNRPDSLTTVSLYLNGFSENSQTPGGLTQAQYDADPTQSQHSGDQFYSKRFSTALSFTKSFKKYHQVSSSVYGNYFVRDWWIAYKNPTNDGFLRDIHAIGNVTDYKFSKDLMGMKNSLIAGTRVHSDRLDDVNIKGADKSARTGTVTGNNINTSMIYEAYVYDELSLTPDLTFAPGVRYTNIEYRRNNFMLKRRDAVNAEAFVYSGGIIYKLFGHSRLYATVSKGYQPPTLNAAVNPGNIDQGVDLQAETSLNYEAGFRTDPLPWISLNASVYRMDFSNKVISENGINRNAGSSFHRGIEAELELGAWQGISFFMNGTLQKATFTSGETAGNILPNAPGEMAAAGLRYRFPFENHRLVLNLFNNYVGKQFSDAKNTVEGTADGKNGAIPAYNVVNATLNYSYRQWGFYVNVNNLTDEKYFTLRWASWNGIIPSPGRNFMAGVTVKF